MRTSDVRPGAVSREKYLTFSLGAEGYGLTIRNVQEIVGLLRITRVPDAPEFVKGVVNLRGRIVPVVDLRVRFGLPAQEPGPRSCIVVAQLTQQQTSATLGLLVDEVCEVMQAAASDIAPPPAIGATELAAFVQGVVNTPGRAIILLDLNRLLLGHELPAAACEPRETEARLTVENPN